MRRIAVSLVVLFCCSWPARALVSTNVPLGHWSYDAVEKLAGYVLIDSSMLTTKPLSRLEMARHVGQAREALERMEDPPEVLGAIMERLVREYRAELAQLGVLDGSHDASHLKPIEDPYVKYLYARRTPELENRRGDLFQRGSNVRTGFASRATLFDWFAFYLHPEFAGSEADSDIDLIEGYGKVMLGPLELEAGRDSLWWGPGYHGSILMSNNARPFEMVKITNPLPIQLPWIFRILGPVRTEWFLARLEEDRDFPRAYLSGIRFNAKPHPLVELGISRVVMFGGRGQPHVDLFDYAKMFLAGSEQAENNQLAGIDASFLLPMNVLPYGAHLPLRSVKFYFDGAGEDEAGYYPSNWGYLYGVQLNDLFKTGRTDLRIEYADNRVTGKPNVFYNHSVYTSGYTYHDRVIGHHMGTHAQDLFVQLSHYLREDLIVDLAYNRQTQGASAATRRTRDIYELGLTYFPSPDWQITGGYRFEQRTDRDGDDNHIVEVGLIRRF